MDAYEHTGMARTNLLLQDHRALVASGQKVKRGERIAAAFRPGRGDIHSPVAGKISYVDDHRVAIVAEGSDTVAPVSLEGLSGSGLREKILGLGGDVPAGDHAHTVIINGVDAEDGVFTRRALLNFSVETLGRGLSTVTSLYTPQNTILATPKGIPVPLPDVDRFEIADQYPAGLDPMVARAVTGSEGPEDTVVIGLETVYHLGRIMETGLPVLDTPVTINGQVRIVPVGMPVDELLKLEGDRILNRDRIVLGGVMRGKAAAVTSQGVDRATSAVCIIRNPDPVAVDTACVGCGECVRRCPARLDPAMITSYAEFGMFKKAADEHVDVCFECGLCGHFCIARRPMLQYIRLAKRELERVNMGVAS